MKTNNYLIILTFLAAICFSNETLHGQCLEWVSPSDTTGWNDFNSSFGGAPVRVDGECPFNEIDAFEVFASEAYIVENFRQNNSYTFSICNGPGAGTWVPDFTIVAPSGAIDAFGGGNGDSCSITWTASESGDYFIIINEEGNCGGGDNTGTDNGYPALTCESLSLLMDTCSAGTLASPLELLSCSSSETVTVSYDNVGIPEGGGIGHLFNAGENGTGAIPAFSISNTSNSWTFDNDINGVLSFNELDALEGTWVVRSFIYTDTLDAVNSVCAIAMDSTLVTFSNISLTLTEGEGGSATAVVTGGVAPFDYLWSDLAEQTTETAIGLPNGNVTVTVTDAIGCSVIDTITIVNSEIDACLSWTAPSSVGGWIDFNDEYGGAPLDIGDGCPFNEIQSFEVFASEAYTVDNFVEGTTYSFSMCNGPGAGSWLPEYTIIAPSGAVDASGIGDTCSITWLATESGTYLIVINEENECGGGANTGTANGWPAISCGGLDMCSSLVTEAEHLFGGTAIVNVTGGAEPYTYLWSDDTGATTDTVKNLVDGSYTIEVTDANGCVAIDSVVVMITSVNNIAFTEAINISPNPAIDELTVDLKLNIDANVVLQLIDLNGRVLQTKKYKNASQKTNFSVSDYSSGIYLMRIQVENEATFRKVILTK